jgi:hypothetical protein
MANKQNENSGLLDSFVIIAGEYDISRLSRYITPALCNKGLLEQGKNVYEGAGNMQKAVLKRVPSGGDNKNDEGHSR